MDARYDNRCSYNRDVERDVLGGIDWRKRREALQTSTVPLGYRAPAQAVQRS